MYLKFVLIISTLISSSFSINLLDICQSGIRDDGINYVHCARKSLTEIPHFSSNRLFNLAFDELILSDNFITHIPANAFHGLRIKRLILSGNRLKSIDQNAFRELENYLEEIILEFDPTIVDRIPQAIQKNLVNIKSLTLISLNLRILPSNVFNQMKKLEYLNLKSCHIQTFESNIFQSIENQLRYLYLDYNKLTKDIFNEINRLNFLEKLSLSHNNIQEFDVILSNRNLKYLDLSYNYLKSLFLINFNQLEVLNLQNNLLTSEQMNGSIPKQLKELMLDFNSIHFLNKKWIPIENSLEILSLQSNDFLLTDANVFQYFTKLKKLNLARNNIQQIPQGLFNFTRSLQCLTMDRNPLHRLSSNTFNGLEHSLVNISLQSCSLTSESLIALSSLKNLERLKLQSNFLTKILPSNLFFSMSKLLVLDLQRNQLTEIPSKYPSSLRELELGNNRLTNLPFTNRTLNELSQLITLDLSSNPLQCDCHMQPIYYWLLAHFQAELVSYVQWICSKPKHLAGKQLGTLAPQHFICEEKQLLSFQVRLKDSKTALLEWSSVSLEGMPVNLLVIENNKPLPILYLNASENNFLLENLKPATHYSLCLQVHDEILCRNITTINQKIVSLTSSSESVLMIDIEYLIIGISFGICSVFLILFFLILILIKNRFKYSHSSKTTATTIDSYYQTTGSDITQTPICNKSIEEHSINSLQYHRSAPMFCYCQLPSNYCADQQTYHFYHEIPLTKPPALI